MTSPRHSFLQLRIAAALALACVCAAAQPPPATFTRTISTSSQSVTVDFTHHPIRSANFQVLVQQADGSYATHSADVARTYLGTVQGKPGALACGLLRSDGTLWARVSFEDGTTWTSTGGTASASGGGFTPAWPTSVVSAGGAGATVFAAELGLDSTHNHFTACGGTAAAVVEQCEFSVMSGNLAYLRDTAILHRIGTIVVRADSAKDPYAADGGDTGALLPRVRTLWNTGAPMGSSHDIAAVLHSAANGGLAYVGTIGTSSRYSANDSDPTGDFSVVWRHEAGHNWGSSHYEGGGNPEGSTIMSNNALSRFSSSEARKIISHRNTKTAILDNLGPYPFPIPPRANQDAVAYLRGTPKRIDVLANDADSNGETLALLSFDGESHLGGALSRSAGTGPGGRDEILYTPPATLASGTDWFRYRIQDSSGMQAVGHAMLRPVSEILTPADHWTLDDTAGTNAANRVRSTHNGTHQNGALPGQPGANSVTRTGAYFDGSNDQTSIPAPGYNTNTLTFTAWIKRDGSQNAYAPVIFTRAGSSVAGLHFGSASELRYTWDGAGHTWNSGITVPDNTWCLAAMCVSPSGTTLRLRTPAGLQSAANPATQSAEAFNGTMYLGYDSNSSSRRFRGWLDDVRVYKATLTAEEVESLYQQAVSPPAVTLTSPSAGSAVPPLDVALAANIDTLAELTDLVEFVENDSPLASAAAFPWQARLAALAPGTHTLAARASFGDWGYQVHSAPVTFTALPAPLPTITVAASLPASKRGPIPGVFTFTRDHPIGSVTVPFSLGGTAIAGTDFEALPASVTLPDGALTSTLAVAPIEAAPDSISETLVLTLAGGAGYTLGSPASATLTIDDHITSIAAGAWNTGATWNSGSPAPVSGTQNSGEGYAVAHTVTSNNTGSNSQALVAGSLRVKSGGVLDLARLHASTNQNVSYNLPATTVENGGTIQFRCSTGSSTHTVAAALAFAGPATLRLTGGGYDNDANLTGTLSGGGNVSVLSDTGAGGGTYVRQVSINKADNPFSGDWSVTHSGGGDELAALRAGASNALGTGTVTVGTRAQLINDHATGLDSLSGVILNGAASSLLLNQPWSNTAARLDLAGGSPVVRLGNAASAIGDLSGSTGVIQGSGTSSSLTVNQTGDRVFSGNLGASLRFVKSGPATLTLAGSLDPALALGVHSGTLVPPAGSTIGSLQQNGGSLRLALPASPAAAALTLTGALTHTGGSIDVDVASAPLTDTPYTLLRYQGALGGTPEVAVHDNSGSGLLAVVSLGGGSDSAITVLFIEPPPPEYTLTYTAGGGGSISGASPQIVSEGNDGQPVTAVPDPGYSFVQWSDGSTSATRTDTNITSDLSVEAVFSLNQYPVTYAAEGNGGISGEATQTVPHGADAQPVTAVPEAGAWFVAWSDGLATPWRADTQVTGPVSATARFLPGDGPVSIASGAWSDAATWSHGLPAPAEGAQGEGFAYTVEGFTVTSNNPSSNNQALVGASVLVRGGGLLDLARLHNHTLQTATHNLPPLVLSESSTLRFRASNGSNHHLLAAPVTVSGNTTLLVSGGNYANDATLSGPLAGNGSIAVLSDTNAASSAANTRTLTVSSPDNPFAGNWSVTHGASGDDFAALRAGAANALGTGTVTVGTRSRLVNDAAAGIDSLAGVTLSGTESRLELNHPWIHAAATLHLGHPGAVVHVGDSASSIGRLSGSAGTIQGGTPESRLVVHPVTDADFGGDLTGPLQFEKSGPATLVLSGTNTHSGETRVSGGTLSGSGSASSALVVGDGATLRAETETFLTSSATFESGSTFSVRFDSSSLTGGRLSTTGPVSIQENTTLSLEDAAAATLADGDKLVLIDSGGQPVTGTFAALPEGAVVTVGANNLVISYQDTLGGTGHFVTLTAVVPDPYQDWIAEFPAIADSAMREPAADADADGLANAIEFVLGSDPSAFTASPLVPSTDGGLTVSFTRVKAAGDAGFATTVEFADDLEGWTAAGPEMIHITDLGESEVVTATIPVAGERLFVRLRVNIPDR